MPDEQEKEGIDPEPADLEQEHGDAEPELAAAAGDGETAAAEASDGDEEKDEPAADGDDDGDGLGDLMDIFSDESDVAESDAGLLDEFLEELTMDQVSEEADRLLEEFRAI